MATLDLVQESNPAETMTVTVESEDGPRIFCSEAGNKEKFWLVRHQTDANRFADPDTLQVWRIAGT